MTKFWELFQRLLEGETVNPSEQQGFGPRTEPGASRAQSRSNYNRTSTFSLKCLVRRESAHVPTEFTSNKLQTQTFRPRAAACTDGHCRYQFAVPASLALCAEASEEKWGSEFSRSGLMAHPWQPPSQCYSAL